MISGTEAYLVFEFFAFTLEQALNNLLIKDDNKIKVAKQIMNILKSLQKEKKMIKDFRPGVLGITDKMKIKLLDFGKKQILNLGFLISEKLINQEIVDPHRIKYMPPESLLFLVEDLSFDVWSFGCILILNPIYKLKVTYRDLCKLHDIDLFPVVPNDINGLMKDLIVKCLDRNYETRISIAEHSKYSP